MVFWEVEGLGMWIFVDSWNVIWGVWLSIFDVAQNVETHGSRTASPIECSMDFW